MAGHNARINVYRQLQRHLDECPLDFLATESGVEIRILRAALYSARGPHRLALSAVPEPGSKIRRRLTPMPDLDTLLIRLEDLAERG